MMNLITPLLPALRIGVFGAVTWGLATIRLPGDFAGPVTDWLMAGLAGAIAAAYGAWAAKREIK
jgi:hypothetical protein